jgi:hypothetical protein
MNACHGKSRDATQRFEIAEELVVARDVWRCENADVGHACNRLGDDSDLALAAKIELSHE